MTTPSIDIVTAEGQPASEIALRGLRVRSRLAGLAERTRIEQSFANLGDRPIEPIYTFPLPDGATVCGFEVLTEERVLTGVVDEQGTTLEQYEDAIGRGDGAYLLEHERDDIFTVRVGALRPGQVATLHLEYVRDVQVVDRQIRLELPMTLAPRYVGSSGMDPLEALLEADAVNPPKAYAVPYGLSFELVVELGRIAQISSPTHELRIEESEEHSYRVGLEGGEVVPDRSIVVKLELQSEDAPRAQVELGPDGARYAAISFVPDLPETTESEPADIVFVVDCSGSMRGASIAQARRALELCLRSMKEGDRFRVLRFGMRYEELTDGPTRYDAQSLTRVLEQVAGIEADLGGTELHSALAHVFATRRQWGADGSQRPTQVLLLTDGRVFNEDETIALAREHAGTHRVFTFGIGPAASQALVNGLARVTDGAAESIAYEERIEDKVLRSFSRLDSPRIDDVRIGLEGAEFELARERMPAIFDGDALIVLARWEDGEPGSATLRCRRMGEEWESRVALPAELGEGGGVPQLWARHRIRELEDAARGARENSRFVRSREEHLCKRLIELSKRFGIVCSKTAFFAVEHRRPEDRARGLPELQRVPVQPPRSEHELLEALLDELGIPEERWEELRRRDAMRRPAPVPKEALRHTRRGSSLPPDVPTEPLGASAPLCSSAPDAACAPEDPLFDLLALQGSAGDFADPSALLPSERRSAWLLLDSAELLKGENEERILYTLWALASLQIDHADRRSTWLRAARKARVFPVEGEGLGRGGDRRGAPSAGRRGALRPALRLARRVVRALGED